MASSLWRMGDGVLWTPNKGFPWCANPPCPEVCNPSTSISSSSLPPSSSSSSSGGGHIVGPYSCAGCIAGHYPQNFQALVQGVQKKESNTQIKVTDINGAWTLPQVSFGYTDFSCGLQFPGACNSELTWSVRTIIDPYFGYYYVNAYTVDFGIATDLSGNVFAKAAVHYIFSIVTSNTYTYDAYACFQSQIGTYPPGVDCMNLANLSLALYKYSNGGLGEYLDFSTATFTGSAI
jgi:hypothetical protein